MKRLQRGLTLLEVVVSVGILTIILLSVAATMASAITMKELQTERREARTVAESKINEILASQNLTGYYDNTTGAADSPVGQWDFTAEYNPSFGSYPGQNYSATLQIRSFYIDSTTDPSNPTLVEIDPTSSITVGSPAGAPAWGDGEFFEITTEVKWYPAVQLREAVDAASAAKLTAVATTLDAVLYPEN